MAKLNFKATSKGRSLKVTPSKYRESAGRPNISQSDGIRPAFPLMPWEGLSAKDNYEDVSTQDNIVIPKGKIVSAITANSDMGAAYDGGNIYGVGKGVMGLMVPANGGTNKMYLDAANEYPANVPIGVAEHDVYEYLGSDPKLNYQARNKNWGVLCHQLIKLPSIDVDAFDTFFGTADHFMVAAAASAAAMYTDTNTDGIADSLTDASDAYYKLNSKYSWLTAGSDGTAGKMLRSDFYGNWMIAADDGSDGSQVVGKLMGIDYRMNKDLLDTVQSKYDAAAFRTSGTGTMGVPQFLYDFAYEAIDWAIKGAGTTWSTNSFVDSAGVTRTGEDAAKIIYEATEAGVFGEAWILVNV